MVVCGIGMSTKMTYNLSGTFQILHNIRLYTLRGTDRVAKFAYLDGVQLSEYQVTVVSSWYNKKAF